MLESYIEKRTRIKVLEWAQSRDITVVAIKLSMLRGWPDRLFLWQGRGVLFVEFKQPGEKPRPLQKHIHKIIESLGFKVQIHDDIDRAVEAITREISSQTGAGSRG
jgi:hypothetical protein